MAKRVGGVLYVTRNGERLRVLGNFTCVPSGVKREAVVGADGVHGYKEMPTEPMIEGEATDTGETSLTEIFDTTDATIVAELANGRVFSLTDAWYAGDRKLETEAGKYPVLFQGTHGDFQ